MCLQAFVAAPAIIAQSTLKARLLFWMPVVVGMVWRFIVPVGYHVHKFWCWPSLIPGSLGIAWAATRYRSMWM